VSEDLAASSLTIYYASESSGEKVVNGILKNIIRHSPSRTEKNNDFLRSG